MNKSNEKISSKDISDKEYFFGHKACGGCGGSLAIRLALKVLGERTFVVLPGGCMAAVGFIYPQMAFSCNAIISTFAGTASMMSGIVAGAKSQGLKDYNVVGFAGDGGTADIGLQALSGAIDRHDNIIYICYDNEAYMNTGIQKSSLTPFGSKTTTTPVGKNIRGNQFQKKNLFEIVAANGIDYASTSSIGYVNDFINKVNKAKNTNGTSYIQVFAPCPTGWGVDSSFTIKIAKEVVDCGLWFLAEYENGQFKLNKRISEFIPIRDYLSKQSRFKHLTDEDIKIIEENRDKQWLRINNLYKS